jgi:hypothetical protein
MAKLLPTIEAFRTKLRAKYPDRTDLLQITSAAHLVYAKSFELQDPGPAHEVLAAIRSDVASGKLRLRGVLETGMPNKIELDHRVRGELDILGGTLTVEDKDSFGFIHRKTYRRVYFYAKDLALPEDNEAATDHPDASSVTPTASILPSPPAKPRRRTSPEQARALKAIKAIYGRIPPQDEVSNTVLDQAVNKHLKQEDLEAVKKDAIQRAAGRRR